MKTKVVLLAVVLLSTSLFAQYGRGFNRDANRPFFGRMASVLDLSDDQRAEIKKLFDEHRDKVYKERVAEREDFMNKIKSVLNDEQAKKFELLQEMRKDGLGRGAGIDARLERLTERLNLNEEQQQKVKELMDKCVADFGPRFREFGRMNNRRNNCCCCGNRNFRKAGFSKRAPMLGKYYDEFMEILTDEQKEEFKKMREERPAFGRRGFNRF